MKVFRSVFHSVKSNDESLRAEFFDDDIFVADDGARIAVDLNRNHARFIHAGLRLREVHSLDSVEPQLNARPFRSDTVFVPFAQWLACFLEYFFRRLR